MTDIISIGAESSSMVVKKLLRSRALASAVIALGCVSHARIYEPEQINFEPQKKKNGKRKRNADRWR